MGDDFPFRGMWPDFLNYNYGGLDLLQAKCEWQGFSVFVSRVEMTFFFSKDDGQRKG